MVKIVRANLATFAGKLQSSDSFGGFCEPAENMERATGFWTGVIRLAYGCTGEAAFQKARDIRMESFLK